MFIYFLILLVLAHFILALWLWFRRSNQLRGRKEYLVPVLFLPLFGPLIAVTIDILHRTGRLGARPVELDAVKAENEIYWSSIISGAKEDHDAVPLEEAILLNDRQTRRKAVLNTFRGDSFRYLDVLMLARNNEDVDTTHYATIQITKIQRQFQLKLQKFAQDIDREPDNLALLDEYIDLLETYLQSSLPEKSILRHQREVYAKLLERRLALAPDDKLTLVRKLRNDTDIGEDYTSVLGTIDRLRTNWPGDELVWIEALRACVEWKDSARIQEMIQKIQTQKIHWTKWGRQQVSPWVQVR